MTKFSPNRVIKYFIIGDLILWTGWGVADPFYLIQFIKAVGFSLYIPGWLAIYSRHLDKGHTAFEWAVNSSAGAFGIGLAGIFGGSIANWFGFEFVFISTSLLAFLSAIILFFSRNFILPKDKIKIIPDKQTIRNQ